MNKGDVVKFIVDRETRQGRVLWIDKEQAGIVMKVSNSTDTAAIVMPVKDCKVVIEFKGNTLKDKIHGMETEELKASIERLKGMRFPKKVVRRARASVAPSKKKKMTRLLELLEEDPGALDGLIQKALNEDKEVKG